MASETKNYFLRIRSFSLNARLFLVATALQGLGLGIWGVIFYLYLNLGEVGFSPNFIGNMFSAGAIGKLRAIVACQFLSMPFIMLVTISPNLALSTGAYLARGTLMQMGIPLETAFQMEMVTENERATTSGLMTMADNIPRAVSSSISGGMMSGSDFYTPFLFTTLTYFVSSSLLYVLFRKAKAELIET